MTVASMHVWIAVALGGAVGACLRYGAALAMPHSAQRGELPWQTLLVNALGTALLAALVVITLPDRASGPAPRAGALVAFVGTGLCGALTTFSTFAVEAVTLARGGHTGLAVAYVALNLVVCLLAAAAILAVVAGR